MGLATGRRIHALLLAVGLPGTAIAASPADILVTAGKTGAMRLQDIPMAITAIGGNMLNETGAADIRDLVALAPGLQITQATSFAQMFIRGIGSNNVYGGSDPSVSVQMDGVYLGRPAAYLTDFLDVDRIEILRGPQTALYGRNTIGGTINVVSLKPGDSTEATIRLTGGNYGLARGEARISGPITPGVLAASVAISGTRHGAYLKNIVPDVGDVDNERSFGLRGQIRLTPSPAAEVILRADYSHADDAIAGYAKLLQATADPLANGILGDFGKVALNTPSASDRRIWGVALESTVDLGGASLKTVGAWRESRIRQSGDSDSSALNLRRTVQNEDQRQLSQEVDLNGKTGRLSWIVGGSWFHEHIDTGASLTSFPSTRTDFTPVTRTDALAAFGSGDYSVTDGISLTASLRYSREQKHFDQTGTTILLATGLPLAGFPQSYRLSGVYHALSPKLGLELRPASHLLFYASVTHGFKSGGFNFSSPNPNQGFAPERLWSYEGGAKLDLLGGAVQFNPTVFHYDYTDLQVQTFLSPGLVDIGNAASARVDGIELEVTGAVTPWLRLGGNLGWLDARYRDYRSAPGPGNIPFDASGNRLNLAPTWSGLVYGEIRRRLRHGMLSARAEASLRSRQYFTAMNSGLSQQGGYALIDASIGYAFPGNHLRALLYGRNLGDSRYVTSTASFAAGIAGRVGPPRTYGMRIEWAL